MYILEIIEESMDSGNVLCILAPYFITQRIEKLTDDEYSAWHINLYHIPDAQIKDTADILIHHIKPTWYCHAFNDKKLFVILKGKWFELPPKKDKSWNEMIAYGTDCANVERHYLETIPTKM